MNTIHITRVPNPNIRYFQFESNGLLKEILKLLKADLPMLNIDSSDDRNFRIEKKTFQSWIQIEEAIIALALGDDPDGWAVKRSMVSECVLQSQVEGCIATLHSELDELIELLQ